MVNLINNDLHALNSEIHTSTNISILQTSQYNIVPNDTCHCSLGQLASNSSCFE